MDVEHEALPSNEILRVMQGHFDNLILGLELIENPRDVLHFLVDRLCDEGAKVVHQRENLQ